jgi:hypothetical protein
MTSNPFFSPSRKTIKPTIQVGVHKNFLEMRGRTSGYSKLCHFVSNLAQKIEGRMLLAMFDDEAISSGQSFFSSSAKTFL